jgi:hypothetical protein
MDMSGKHSEPKYASTVTVQVMLYPLKMELSTDVEDMIATVLASPWTIERLVVSDGKAVIELPFAFEPKMNGYAVAGVLVKRAEGSNGD